MPRPSAVVASPDLGIDVSDADALVGDVKDPKTFYSVAPPKKTGTMPTVALAPGSSAYPEGYHAGDGGGLPAIDVDLVTGNIKYGKTIFNVAGHTDVRNVSDANALVGEVKTGRTFYAVGGAKKTGTFTPEEQTIAGGTLRHSNDPEHYASPYDVWVKVKEIKLNASYAGIRVKFDMRAQGVVQLIYGRIYKNGAATGTERSQTSGTVTYTEDLSNFLVNDLLQVYGKANSGGAGTFCHLSNFRIYYDFEDLRDPPTNQDP